MQIDKRFGLMTLAVVMALMVAGASISAQDATPEATSEPAVPATAAATETATSVATEAATPEQTIEATVVATQEATQAATAEVTPEATAEATSDVAVMRVEIPAEDGLTLVGDLYNAQLNVQTPAILLLHMYGGNRNDWHYFIQTLTAQGYRVLTVDLRGHGETGGTRSRGDWQKAINDTQLWLNWMESQPSIDADRIGIVGASIGSNLALVGCAADSHCKTVVAMSPAKDYFGVTTSDAITTLRQRPALIMGSQRDLPSGPDIRTMAELSVGEIDVHLFPGQKHGLALFGTEGVSDEIMNWLNGRLK